MDAPIATDMDFPAMQIAELAPMIRDRMVSPVDLVEAHLQRIAALDGALHSFITVTADRARARALEAEVEIAAGHYRGPFHGIPYALKDIVDIAGVRTTAHSRLMPESPAAADAPVAARLNAAGGIVLGKLATFEFALGGPSWDLPWPPALNPWNLGYLPGGSSSGSGAAVAARFVAAAIGTDTGGSVRWPAAVCGIVGLKPTYGLLSRRLVQPNTFSLDHCGPMTRTVADCAIMLQACAGPDPFDPGSADTALPDYSAALTGSIAGLRLGWIRGFYAEEASQEVTEAVDAAVAKLGALGATIVELDLGGIGDYCDCKSIISMSELFTIHKPDLQSRPEQFGAKLRQRVIGGAFIRAEDYLQAQRWRTELVRRVLASFTTCDALLTAGWLTTGDRAEPGGADMFRTGRNVTMPFSLAGIPAMSVPCGFGQHGLPLSLQIAGRPFDESPVLRVGDTYQRATDWHLRAPQFA